jgi:molecular chaperone Hsp33
MRTGRKENRRNGMKDTREEWYDAALKVAVTFVDVTTPAQELARAHLSGPVGAHYLAEALAAVALLGAETSLEGEVVSLQMKCAGPLGGVNVECSRDGALRGYTEKKVLDGFDGMGAPKDEEVVGERRCQVTRSVPGRVVSQGIAATLDGYFASSLQRRARIFTAVSVSDEVEVLQARALLVEALPDSAFRVETLDAPALSVSPRTVLSRLGLRGAELKKSQPLRFACRCSPERAAAMLSAMDESERSSLPEKIDITCHMCGRTFTVATGSGGTVR